MNQGADNSLQQPPFCDDPDDLWVAADIGSNERAAIVAAVDRDGHLRQEIEHFLGSLGPELRIAFLGALGRSLLAAPPKKTPAAAVLPALEHTIGVALSGAPMPRPAS